MNLFILSRCVFQRYTACKIIVFAFNQKKEADKQQERATLAQNEAEHLQRMALEAQREAEMQQELATEQLMLYRQQLEDCN